MHIISRKQLLDGALWHSGSENGLDAWYRIAKKAEWQSLEDIWKIYPSADGVKVAGGRIYTVFNIAGNSYRLIVKIDYRYQKIYVKHVLTHAEYDKGDWKK